MTTIQVANAAIVCRKPAIAGFEPQHKVAVGLLGSVTSNIHRCNLYITAANGFLYVESNYLSPDSNSPTKIALALGDDVDLRTLVLNVIYEELPKDLKAATRKIDDAISNDIKFYIDREAIRNSTFRKLDFSTAENIDWSPPPPDPLAVTTQRVDLTQEATLPNVTSLKQPELPPPKPPEGLVQVLILMLWSNVSGKCVLICIILGAGLLAVWATLPDSFKERILNRCWPENTPRKQKQNDKL